MRHHSRQNARPHATRDARRGPTKTMPSSASPSFLRASAYRRHRKRADRPIIHAASSSQRLLEHMELVIQLGVVLAKLGDLANRVQHGRVITAAERLAD